MPKISNIPPDLDQEYHTASFLSTLHFPQKNFVKNVHNNQQLLAVLLQDVFPAEQQYERPCTDAVAVRANRRRRGDGHSCRYRNRALPDCGKGAEKIPVY